MSNKQILIIIAPFGFGPAAKGLYLADKLAVDACLTLVSTGSAYSLVNETALEGVRCLNGRIHELFTISDLTRFNLIISINNAPAVHILSKAGFGGKLVFIDDLLQWRGGIDDINTEGKMLAYLVQDFPGAAEHLHLCHSYAQSTQLIAPMIWSRSSHSDYSSVRQGITLCLGGVTSPLVNWHSIRDQIEALICATYESCKNHAQHLTVIGNQSLSELEIGSLDGIDVLGAVSPQVSSKLIARSELLLTTPGIGTVYEAMVTNTPMLLLPPTNSTQLQQYKVFEEGGIAHVLQGSLLLEGLWEAFNLPWPEHAGHCVNWIEQYFAEVASSIECFISNTQAVSNVKNVEKLIEAQKSFMDGLSDISVIEILLELLEKNSCNV